MPSQPMQNLQAMFAVLDPNEPMDLERVYTDDLEFADPFHRISGRSELAAYFARMNSNIETCTFEFHETVESDDAGFVTWTMRLKTKRGPRKPIVVDGTSHVRYRDGKVCYHRDYFDAAALVYEHVPILGGAIRAIRKRM